MHLPVIIGTILSLAPSHALPTDTVRGTVTDERGRPIGGAEIVVADLDRSVVTNASGEFAIAGLVSGPATLVIRRAGYASVVKEVRVDGETNVQVTLHSQVFAIEPLTVTATRSSLEPAAAPLPADAVGAGELRRSHSVSLAHTIERLAGVHTLSTGMQIGKPVIRGFTGSRVLVLASGLPLEDYSWSDEDGPSVDARLADRVEVIRGPASVLYGSDALSGVVNVIPSPLPDAMGVPAYVRGSVELYGASNNFETGGTIGLSGASGAVGWRATGILRRAESLHTPAGELENTGFAALNGEGAIGVRGSWGNATLRYSRYGGEFRLLEVDAPQGGEPEEEGGPERKLSDDRVQGNANFPFGPIRIEAKAQFQRHWLAEVGDIRDTTTGTITEGTQFDLLLNTLTAEVLGHHVIGPISGSVGVSTELQSNDSRATQPIVPDARIRTAAGFAFEQLRVGPATIFGGARLDARSLDADPNGVLGNPAQQLDWTAVTGDVGLSLQIARGVSVSGNAGRSWRSPNLFELFANGPRIGEARYEIGNAGLGTESAFDLDVGLRVETDVVWANVSGYRNDVSNYIYLAPTGDSIGNLRVYEQEQADALLWGAEAGIGVRPIPALELRTRFDLVRGTNSLTDEPLPLMPPVTGMVGVEIHGPTTWADDAFVDVETQLVAKQTRLAPSDYPTDGYALVNVGIGIDRTMVGHAWHLGLRVQNLTNEAYRDFLSRYKEFALDPGRDVVLRVRTDF